jgi:hypothetical protein
VNSNAVFLRGCYLDVLVGVIPLGFVRDDTTSIPIPIIEPISYLSQFAKLINEEYLFEYISSSEF